MTTEPRDPALAALARATVRVGTGSGVVIRGSSVPLIATAAHVLKGDEPPIVRKGSIFGEASIVARDPDVSVDVALLTPPREIEAFALKLAGDEEAGRPGDAIWGAGFPGGLSGTDPVLVPGVVASVGEQSWANLDGTWGNSGGPICRIVDGEPVVVGVLLGRAGLPRDELGELIGDLQATAKEMSRLRDLWMKGVVAGNIVITNWDFPAFDIEETAVKLATVMSDLAALLDAHFRTGFLRFAPVADLWKLLGPGDDGPSR